jgi:hypothetical protein
MSIGTILLIILVLILLGGFSGFGGGTVLWDRLLRRWRIRPCDCDSFDLGFARQNLKKPTLLDCRLPTKERSPGRLAVLSRPLVRSAPNSMTNDESR